MESLSVEQDFSTAFLSLYEEVKRRFKEKGMHASIQTLEMCQGMILVFMEKGRPLRPYELLDSLLFNPAFSRCKDAKRMVFYILQRLQKIGIVERVEHQGRDGFYRLTNHQAVKTPIRDIGVITDPRTKPLLACWRRVFELRNIIKLWNIPSLGHAMTYELTSLLSYVESLKAQSGEDGKVQLEALTMDVKKLLEEYVNYTRSGVLSPEEAELFHSCDRGVTDFSKKIWWK
jgi:Fe2+ or Zn2+ uptake regulation protein